MNGEGEEGGHLTEGATQKYYRTEQVKVMARFLCEIKGMKFHMK